MLKPSLFMSSCLIAGVSGHGHLTSPRSRNWLAAEDGVNSATPGKPPKDYCPHCLNVNTANGLCGHTSYNDYDNYLDSTGNRMPWDSQGVYQAGETITVSSYLDTHHNGVSNYHCSFIPFLHLAHGTLP